MRHFRPLLDPGFKKILAPRYGEGVSILLNGRRIPDEVEVPGRVPISIRVAQTISRYDSRGRLPRASLTAHFGSTSFNGTDRPGSGSPRPE